VEDMQPDPFAVPCNDCNNRQYDSAKFRKDLESAIPYQICGCCNHLLSSSRMSKTVHNRHDEMFNLLRDFAGQNPIFADNVDGGVEIRLCLQCEVDLSLKNRNRRIPRFAIVNGLGLGEVPLVLQDLSLIEQRCIAPYNCITSIVRVNKGKSGDQYGVVGGVAHVHNDVGKWYRILPVHPNDTQILQVHVADKKDLAEVPKGVNAFKLRPKRVKEALRWLKDFNPLYKDIDIDFTEFDKWVEENKDNLTHHVDATDEDVIDVQLKMRVVVKSTESTDKPDDIKSKKSPIEVSDSSDKSEEVELHFFVWIFLVFTLEILGLRNGF
jgi:hypothetical protein